MNDTNKMAMAHKTDKKVSTQELVNMLYTLGDMRNDLLTDMYTNHHCYHVYASSDLYETMVAITHILQDRGHSAEQANDIFQVTSHDVSK